MSWTNDRYAEAHDEGWPSRKLTPAAAARNRYPDGDPAWASSWELAIAGTEGFEARCRCGWRSGIFHPWTADDVGSEDLQEAMAREWTAHAEAETARAASMAGGRPIETAADLDPLLATVNHRIRVCEEIQAGPHASEITGAKLETWREIAYLIGRLPAYADRPLREMEAELPWVGKAATREEGRS